MVDGRGVIDDFADGKLTRRDYLIGTGVLGGLVGLGGCAARARERDVLTNHGVDADATVERTFVMGECSLLVEGYVQGNGEERHVRLFGHNRDGAVIGTASTTITTHNSDPYVFKLAIPDKNCGIGNVRGYSVTVDEEGDGDD